MHGMLFEIPAVGSAYKKACKEGCKEGQVRKTVRMGCKEGYKEAAMRNCHAHGLYGKISLTVIGNRR